MTHQNPSENEPACMGGFCAIREACGRFYADPLRMVAEHLCSPGTHDLWRPIIVKISEENGPLFIDNSFTVAAEEGNWL